MLKSVKVKTALVYCLTIIFISGVFSTNMITGHAEPFSKMKEKMVKASEKEKEVLKNLFLMVQEIEEMERMEAQNAQDIKKIKVEIEGLQLKIADEEAAYTKKQENLKQVLRSYQRSGPGSYIEIVLESDNLTTFLRRINALRDITRNTGELLEQMEDSRDKQVEEKAKLAEKLRLVESKQSALLNALNKKKQLKADMEKYLASLGVEKEYYQEYLANIQKLWNDLKSLFSDSMGEFSKMINDGRLPQDAIKLSYNLLNIKGSLDEKVLNDIMSAHSQFPKMEFSFEPGRVKMRVPEKELVLSGTFVIIEGHTLKFKVEEGSFYGMPLEQGAIDELFKGDYLMLDFKPMLYGYSIQSIEIADGHLELIFYLK